MGADAPPLVNPADGQLGPAGGGSGGARIAVGEVHGDGRGGGVLTADLADLGAAQRRHRLVAQRRRLRGHCGEAVPSTPTRAMSSCCAGGFIREQARGPSPSARAAA